MGTLNITLLLHMCSQTSDQRKSFQKTECTKQSVWKILYNSKNQNIYAESEILVFKLIQLYGFETNIQIKIYTERHLLPVQNVLAIPNRGGFSHRLALCW